MCDVATGDDEKMWKWNGRMWEMEKWKWNNLLMGNLPIPRKIATLGYFHIFIFPHFHISIFPHSNPEEYLFPVKKVTHPPLQRKQANRCDNTCQQLRCMNKAEQAFYNCIDIFIEPSWSDDLKKQINENGVHTYDRKKWQVFSVLQYIYPPITECEYT